MPAVIGGTNTNFVKIYRAHHGLPIKMFSGYDFKQPFPTIIGTTGCENQPLPRIFMSRQERNIHKDFCSIVTPKTCHRLYATNDYTF